MVEMSCNLGTLVKVTGSEVKSLREGKAQIADAYARVDNGELWLFQSHIPPWKTGFGFGAHDPDRKRKLLVHQILLFGFKKPATWVRFSGDSPFLSEALL